MTSQAGLFSRSTCTASYLSTCMDALVLQEGCQQYYPFWNGPGQLLTRPSIFFISWPIQI